MAFLIVKHALTTDHGKVQIVVVGKVLTRPKTPTQRDEADGLRSPVRWNLKMSEKSLKLPGKWRDSQVPWSRAERDTAVTILWNGRELPLEGAARLKVEGTYRHNFHTG